MTAQLEVAVVGAGPYGLSLGAHLKARKIDHRLFGRPMQTWSQRMPRGMVLKSEPCDSNIGDPRGELSLRRFCADSGIRFEDYGVPVSLDTFLAYGRWFRERAALEIEEVDVAGVHKNGAGFVLDLESGEQVRARRVVVAAGLTGAAYLPDVLGALPTSVATHSSSHASLEPFAGKRVAVIGAGQSALETAAILAESGADPIVIARRPAVFWSQKLVTSRPLRERVSAPISPMTGPNLKMWIYTRRIGVFRLFSPETRLRRGWKTLGPGGAWWLRERVEPRIRLLAGYSIVEAREDEGTVRLSIANGDDRQDLVVDHVIGCTGYAVDIARFGFLDAEVRDRIRRVGTNPELSAHFESSVPGLYFTGPAATGTFGPAMRFVYGTSFAGRRLASHRSLRSRTPRRRTVTSPES